MEVKIIERIVATGSIARAFQRDPHEEKDAVDSGHVIQNDRLVEQTSHHAEQNDDDFDQSIENALVMKLKSMSIRLSMLLNCLISCHAALMTFKHS